MKFKLGQRVSFSHQLDRQTAWVQQEGRHYFWEPVQLMSPKVGMIVGRRRVKNGYKPAADRVFKATSRFTAYLVVFAMHREPILVLPEHLSDPPSNINSLLNKVWAEELRS